MPDTVPAAGQPSQSGDGLNQLIAAISKPSAPPPMTQTTQQLQPKVHAPVQGTQLPQQRPLNNQATSIKQARRQNSMASLTNAITGAVANIENKKIEQHKETITKVMQSNQNIGDAQKILSDPAASAQDKQTAQGVLDSNKKQMNDILSDPKHAKMLQKAFDVSFTDPEKNKTPEIQAMQAAKKQVASAGIFNADNPAEAKVQTLANTVPGATNSNSEFNTPNGKQNQPMQNMQPGVNQQQAQPRPQATPQQQTPASQTPYADQFMRKAGSQGIQINPQYQAWQAAELKKQQQVTQYIYPKLVEGAIKADAASFKAVQDKYKVDADNHSKEVIAAERSKDQAATLKARLGLGYAQIKARNEIARLQMDAKLGISNDPRIKGTPLQAKIQMQNLGELDKAIAAANKSITDNETLLTMERAKAKNANQNTIGTTSKQLESDRAQLKWLDGRRDKLQKELSGGAESNGNNTYSSGNAGDSDKQPVETVGADESDSVQDPDAFDQ